MVAYESGPGLSFSSGSPLCLRKESPHLLRLKAEFRHLYVRLFKFYTIAQVYYALEEGITSSERLGWDCARAMALLRVQTPYLDPKPTSANLRGYLLNAFRIAPQSRIMGLRL
ncbi:hypothetical protein LSM04_007468 [Trypanosoma melophagium]|uniref:uncharacterized protein n=1 Tax=Trypanosoma melophagium TaxID=715481 RepID=UPI003519EE6F|nr:hypothetical protein LSM04_007468 [Trypanosoma melophagium]